MLNLLSRNDGTLVVAQYEYQDYTGNSQHDRLEQFTFLAGREYLDAYHHARNELMLCANLREQHCGRKCGPRISPALSLLGGEPEHEIDDDSDWTKDWVSTRGGSQTWGAIERRTEQGDAEDSLLGSDQNRVETPGKGVVHSRAQCGRRTVVFHHDEWQKPSSDR